MRRIPIQPTYEGDQEARQGQQDQFYHPEIQQSEKVPQQQQQAPDHLQRLEEYALGMISWATEMELNLYSKPPKFG